MSARQKTAFIFAVIFIASSVLLKASETTKNYDYKDFSGVDAGWGMHVKISQSNSYSIEVRADERDFEYFKAEKSGDKVRFYIDKNSYRKRGEIYITITMPALTDLRLSGGSTCDMGMDISKKFEAELSGGSGLKGSLKCADASLSLSGGSRINLSGNGKMLKLEGSGGSFFKMKGFTSTGADIDLSGGSEASLTVNGKLRTSESGGSRVTYSGNTVVENTSLSGGSKIVKE